MKKKDREKLDQYIDRLAEGLKYCFNREYTSKYMNRFVNMKYQSMLYNNEFVKLHLDILESNGINDTTEGFVEEYSKIEHELNTYFCTNFKKSLKERWAKFTVIRNNNDLVTHCPPALFRFCHVGKILKIHGNTDLVKAKWVPKCIKDHYPQTVYDGLVKYENEKEDK